jgi:hypothetical protein
MSLLFPSNTFTSNFISPNSTFEEDYSANSSSALLSLLQPPVHQISAKMEAYHANDDSITPAPSGDINGAGGRKLETKHDEYLSRYQTASSVVIPREVFETMYLSPYNRTQGHLRSTFGNPTPMYIIFSVPAYMH